MNKIALSIIVLILLMPMLYARSPYLTGFVQLTAPNGNFAERNIGGAQTGYGAGADLNVFLHDNIVWRSTVAFSSNKLTDPISFQDELLRLSDSYFYYNLPVVTGIAWQSNITENIEFSLFVQAGVNYAEFPNIEGTIEEHSKYPDNIETSFQGRTNRGYVVGGGVTLRQKATLSVRYMNFGDYVFSGEYYSSRTMLYRDIQQKTFISFFMATLGFNINFSDEK